MVLRYEIIAAGTVSPLVRAAFEDFDVLAAGDGRIHLAGSVADESALHGVLHRMQDLGLSILELRQTGAD